MTATEDATSMDAKGLYKEDIYTDRKVGTIKRLTPVTGDGQPDPARAIIYTGETQILLGNNPLPIAFEIPAGSLAEAAQKFSGEAHKAAEDTVKKLEEMRREMASQIVVPGQGGMGGAPGGGKIQIP